MEVHLVQVLKRSKPSPAMAVALMSLFVALSGVAYATVSKNSVKSKHVKDGALQGKDLKADTVTGAQVAESTLTLPSSATPSGAAGGDLSGTYPNPLIGNDKVTSAKVAADSLTAADLAPDSVGSSEVAADSLTAGDLAPDSVGSSEIAANAVGTSEVTAGSIGSDELKAISTVQQTTPIAGGAGTIANLQVNCPAGTQIISGGGFPGLGTTDMVSNIVNGNGWFVAVQGNAAGADLLTVRAFCLAI